MKRVAIFTLGCKVNQFECAALAEAFQTAGCELVSSNAQADICVINTCAVTNRAGQQSRQLIRRCAQRNPGARLVLTGCYAQLEGPALQELCDAPCLMISNGDKDRLVGAALNLDLALPWRQNMRDAQQICHLPLHKFPGRTRAYLRIQDGCDHFCSYCIVPFTRGRSRSLALEAVLQQAAAFADAGYQELVLTGVNTGKYGLDLREGQRLTTLLHRLCLDFPHIRFRLSSIDPLDVNDALVALLLEHGNFMPHLHIPLQSGDDEVLAQMRRGYSAKQLAATIHRLHRARPQLAIGCDLLCGFPGETEQAAERTFHLLESLPISFLHVFPYSKRPGTAAALMSGQVATAVKAARVARLRQLDLRKRQQFYAANQGRILQVLVERHDKKNGVLRGFSENYIPLRFNGPETLLRRIVSVRFEELRQDEPWGMRIDQKTDSALPIRMEL